MNSAVCVCLLSGLAFSLAATDRQPLEQEIVTDSLSETNDRVAGLYIKEGDENGQLRFFGTGLTGNANSVNAAINQFITQRQDLLEQLRPAANANNFGTGLGTTGLGTNIGTGTVTGFGTGAGVGALGTGGLNGGVRPIVVNLGNGGANNNQALANTGANQANVGGSPIAGLLPQIIAQGAANAGIQNQRRRRPANRRVVNRRRGGNNRRRGTNPKAGQIYVIRPNN